MFQHCHNGSRILRGRKLPTTIPPAKSASISFLTSATGRITIRTRRRLTHSGPGGEGLGGARLTPLCYRVRMANPEHVAKLKEGVEVWNPWKIRNVPGDLHIRDADLTGADLHGAQLNGADLIMVDLTGAYLFGAKLRSAKLGGAYLSRADLSGADLTGAVFHRGSLSGANLSGANLCGADLSSTNLSLANLTGARLDGVYLYHAKLRETVFGNVDLRNAQGLDECFHEGPSTIDYRTLALSGPLPLAFLRGCGLPDNYINYLPSLLNQPVQFYSCFISYSTEDQAFANRLHADLQNSGVRCWFSPHDIQGGKKIHEQIDAAIHLYDRLLLILSKASMAIEWVKTEIAKARRRELREKHRMLFPVRLVDFESLQDWECFDADTGKDSAREIREYFIPDLSNWKDHDSYEKAFDGLLRDLKADQAKAQKA